MSPCKTELIKSHELHKPPGKTISSVIELWTWTCCKFNRLQLRNSGGNQAFRRWKAYVLLRGHSRTRAACTVSHRHGSLCSVRGWWDLDRAFLGHLGGHRTQGLPLAIAGEDSAKPCPGTLEVGLPVAACVNPEAAASDLRDGGEFLQPLATVPADGTCTCSRSC